MSSFKPSLLLCLLLLASSSFSKQAADATRPISSSQYQNDGHKHYKGLLGTLGVVCKCCDGPDGLCTSTWSMECSDLRCLPWKQA
ncbi:unnamed protein product [Rhodiola kirilowii]